MMFRVSRSCQRYFRCRVSLPCILSLGIPFVHYEYVDRNILQIEMAPKYLEYNITVQYGIASSILYGS
jgi:hypothetical protein